jgi:hypothetical protein
VGRIKQPRKYRSVSPQNPEMPEPVKHPVGTT